MSFVNTDATSYQSKYPNKYLETSDKTKKKKYVGACLKHNLHFFTYIVSVDGLLGIEAGVTLKRVARCLATKWKET